MDEWPESDIHVAKAILDERDVDLDDYETKKEPKKETDKIESEKEVEKNKADKIRQIFEYKIVEQKAQSMLTGKLKSSTLENIINQHASEGWQLDKILDSNTLSLFGGKDMFMIIFRREK